jgi:hypothetical protein
VAAPAVAVRGHQVAAQQVHEGGLAGAVGAHLAGGGCRGGAGGGVLGRRWWAGVHSTRVQPAITHGASAQSCALLPSKSCAASSGRLGAGQLAGPTPPRLRLRQRPSSQQCSRPTCQRRWLTMAMREPMSTPKLTSFSPKSSRPGYWKSTSMVCRGCGWGWGFGGGQREAKGQGRCDAQQQLHEAAAAMSEGDGQAPPDAACQRTTALAPQRRK